MRRLGSLLLIVAGLVAGIAVWGWYDYTRPGPLVERETVFVADGSGAQAIAGKLSEAGVIRHRLLFLAAVRVTDRHARLKAGEYAFSPGVSLRTVIDKIVAGDTIVRKVTIAEGLTTRDALRLIEQAEGLTGTVPAVEEGALLPDTYHYTKGDSRPAFVARIRNAMDEARERIWSGRTQDLPLESPSDLVTLASIVERETGVPDERPRVAAVFINRLRLGMPLQSDPTVAFALERDGTRLDRPLTRADLTFDSPYNTYARNGLPPGPIANPGTASLEAVAHPAESDDLYFVADGTGGHAFARSLDDHNSNVRRWRKIQQDSRPQPR